MRGRRAGPAEVSHRLHQSRAEVVLSDAIHQNPGGERVPRLHEPFGQRRPAPAGVGRPLRFFQPIGIEAHAQNGGDSRSNRVQGILVLSPAQDMNRRRPASHVGKAEQGTVTLARRMSVMAFP